MKRLIKHKPAFDPLAGKRCACEHLVRQHGHWLYTATREPGDPERGAVLDPDAACLKCWHCRCEAPS